MITQERLVELLSYCTETGTFKWKPRRCNQHTVGGKIAGSIDSYGYRQIEIDGRGYLAHRLAWLYVYGVWPSSQVDHINRDKTNNAIANLRLVTNKQNQENQGRYKNNKSGYRGVMWHKGKKCYVAQIRHNLKCYALGQFETAEAAYEAYRAAAARLHSHNPYAKESDVPDT